MADRSLRYHDLDTETSFQSALQEISHHGANNFFVRCDAASVVCATDLTVDQIQESVRVQSSARGLPCRWLNAWSSNPDERAAIRAVLASYGISPRLTHLLSPVARPRQVSAKTSSSSTYSKQTTTSKAVGLSTSSSLGDEEHAEDGSQKRTTFQNSNAALSMTNVPEDLWHFCSIDWGRRYVCISYNALFTSTCAPSSVSSRRPDAIRVWSAIILCDDGTVVSVSETPQGLPPEGVKIIRKNQINVLKNLSHQYDPTQAERSMFQVDLRPSRPTAAEATPETFDCFELASRLFYYIFDDWRATYELVSGRQHPYRQKLDDFRARMTHAPAVNDVEELHLIGQQLLTLQRVYQGYEKILERLLRREQQSATLLWRTAHRKASSPTLLTQQWSNGPDAPAWVTEADGDHKTIKLPLGTVARFERLLDRIHLYALAEIEGCLAEKESLVLMVCVTIPHCNALLTVSIQTFNLVNLKNATSIERLTRTTILLAKVTILFLPVSLMTGYFGVSLEAVSRLYSVKTYWASFAIVGALTTLLLLSLDLANSKVSGKLDYQSLTTKLLRRVKRKGSELHEKTGKKA